MSCGRRDFNDGMDAPPIDSPAAACIDPPAGCMEPVVYVCGGVCYAKCRQTVSRAAAAAACTDWGGCLAVAKTQNANDCARAQLAGDTAWFGLLQPTSATLYTADWAWCDGSPATYTSWRAGEPDDNNLSENSEQNCGVLYPDGSWSDESCSLNQKFVCSR